MIDTHTHLYVEEFEDGGAEAVERAIDSGVWMMVFPCIDTTSFDAMNGLHERYPDNTRIGIGLHPTELGNDFEHLLDDFEQLLEKEPSRFCAIGETGIDLYWEKENVENQKRSFARHYQWALKYDLPLIIHCREGIDEVLDVISSFKGEYPKMIFHSFTYGAEEVKRIRRVCDPYFGINGVVTFKNAGQVREAVKEIGIERIVLETDSPYLAPVPYRGKRNESSYLGSVRDMIATVLEISPEEVECKTDANAVSIFRL